ncbi:aldehyde dehydrogenase family protein, partial [Staphylococcus aureus]
MAGESGRAGPVFDPSTGMQTAAVDLASVAEVDAAVSTARLAWAEWRHSSLSTRTAVMFRFRELLDSH